MEFRILGPLEVVTSDGRRPSFGPRQTKVLAALLLAADRVVPTSELIDAVWDGEPPATARRQIHNCVWALRKHLAVTGDGAGYRIATAGGVLDARQFEALIEESRAAAARRELARAVELLRAALRLWRGPALAGCASRAIEAGAARLNEQRLTAVEQRLDLELDLGAGPELIGELSELVAAHPLRERLVGQFMRALHAAGRQADALAAYRQLRVRLADELGIEPVAALRDLHTAILRDELAVPAAAADPAVPGPTTVHDALDPLVRELAVAVEAQWRAEAATRSLQQPAPIPITWTRVRSGVTAGVPAILATRAGQGAEPATEWDLPAGGALDQVADILQRLPNRQLVVLGPPGSGKSTLAMILTLDLLARRGPTDPVPVLLTLSGWNPDTEHLDVWIARRLAVEYPALGNPMPAGHRAARTTAAAALVARHRLIPVLDGLDEMPLGLQAAALTAVNDAAGYGRPMVVTCRGDEYRRAVASSGVIVAHALVITLSPIRPASAIAYLADAGPVDDARWAPVFAHLRDQPDGVLARALSTPLMVWLARTVYLPAATDPAELLDPRRFADPRAVEEHLLAALVPTVYAPRPPAPSAAPRRPYSAAKAGAWLAFLARHLTRHGSPDIAWWQAHTMVPVAVQSGLAMGSVAAIGVLALVAFLAVPALRPGLPVLVVLSLTTIPLVTAVVGLIDPLPWPVHRAGLRSRRRRWSRLVAVTAVSTIAAAFAAPVGGVPLAIGLLLAGATCGLSLSGFGRSDLLRARSPDETYRHDRATLIMLVLGGGLAGVTCGLLAGVLGRDYPVWLLNAIAGTIAFGSVGYLLGRPRYRRVLKHHVETGRASLLYISLGAPLGAAAGAAIGQVSGGHGTGWPVLATGGLIGGLGLGWLAGLAVTGTGWFALVRLYLSTRARLPWRLMPFLADAQQRGVLRQIGGVWQFRHAQLQEHLAAGPHRISRGVPHCRPDDTSEPQSVTGGPTG